MSENLKLYKVYLVYGTKVVMQLYWAVNESQVYELMEWTKKDNPVPIIEDITKTEPCGCLCHHIADWNFYKSLKQRFGCRLKGSEHADLIDQFRVTGLDEAIGGSHL